MQYTIEKLSSIIKEYNEEELPYILKAFHYAKIFHGNQKRANGDDYIIHPLAVAIKLAEVKADKNTICAALLHDVLEDTSCTYENLAKDFNDEIAHLVYGVTKASELTSISRVEKNARNTKKLLLSGVNDVRILIIKLFDRLHNMETLMYLSEEKQKRIALQTMEVYAPVAYYLGSYHIKRILEDLSFKYIDYKNFVGTYEDIYLLKNENIDKLREIKMFLKYTMEFSNIPESEIDLRTKSIYRTYLKLEDGITINNMHDLFSFKILVNEIEECYETIYYFKKLFPFVTGTFTDYIQSEEISNYKAIHSKIILEDGQIAQIKVMTKNMDHLSREGLIGLWDKMRGDAAEEMLKSMRNSNFYKVVSQLSQDNDLDSEKFVSEVKKRLLSKKNIHKL